MPPSSVRRRPRPDLRAGRGEASEAEQGEQPGGSTGRSGERRRVSGRRGTGTPCGLRDASGRSKDASHPPESCTVRGGGPAAIVRCGRPESRRPPCRFLRSRARDPSLPRPALRRATIADPALVVAPPYDVIDPAEHERLLARHPANVVRLDLPATSSATSPTTGIGARPGRWRRGAPTGRCTRIRIRRSTSTSRRIGSRGPTWSRTQRGFFARLRLEAFGAGAGVLPHERTMAAPREDRYKLLRATGVNTSPVVGLYDDPTGAGRPVLDELTGARRRRRPGRRRRRPPSTLGGPGRRGRGRGRRAAPRPPPPAGRSRSPTAITATRRRCAIATNGGCRARARRTRRSTTS